MRLRRPDHFSVKLSVAAAALAASLALASPAIAHDGAAVGASPIAHDGHGMPDMRPEWRGSQPNGQPHHGMQANGPGFDQSSYERAREDWLAVCRHDQRRGQGVGGGLIGGLVGGLLGNRIAGRNDRLLGTVIGGVAGAAAGVAIEKSANRGRSQDYCEAYLNAYSQPSYGHAAYAQPMMMVPMMAPMMAGAQQTHQEPCTETTVTEEWVTVPGRSRTIIRYARPAPDKRVRIAPGKRVRTD